MFSKFTGRYDHTIDSKGRLTIPANYRPLLPDSQAFITQGFDTNLMVMTTEAFESFSQQLTETSLTDPDARQLLRLIFSSTQEVNIDGAGRILIPQFLREVARIESAVVVIGMGSMFELWSPEAWVSQDALLQDASFKHKGYSGFTIKVV
jgi:MraZ protein